jgi:hypothetical protein
LATEVDAEAVAVAPLVDEEPLAVVVEAAQAHEEERRFVQGTTLLTPES